MEKLYLIWSLEHNAWWRPARNGYTTSMKDAGIYTYSDAQNICIDANAPCRGRNAHEAMVPYTPELWK